MNKILLFSGGLDSYIAYHFLNKPKTIYFNLRNKYAFLEQDCINKLIPETIVDYSMSLSRQERLDSFIPYRNIILAMQTASYFDSIAMINFIYLGGVKEDRAIDNTEEAFLEIGRFLNKYGDISIELASPFRHLMKWQIVEWYLRQGLPVENLYETVSCYSGISNYCGKCKSCFRKWVAFKKNNLELPFFNSDLKLEYLQNAKLGVYGKNRNELLLEILG